MGQYLQRFTLAVQLPLADLVLRDVKRNISYFCYCGTSFAILATTVLTLAVNTVSVPLTLPSHEIELLI